MRSLLWAYLLNRHTGCEHCLRPSVNIICFPLLFEGDLKDRGKKIETIEGFGMPDKLHPLQESFVDIFLIYVDWRC